jgi:hypothetical protein
MLHFSKYCRFSLLAAATLGTWAIAAAPTLAANVPTITFNSTEYQTFTPGSKNPIINDSEAAKKALLDDAPAATNVELWYKDEDPTANVGFTFQQGAYKATVTSVTKSDWSLFGKQWFDDFLTAYKPATLSLADIKAQPSYAAALDYIAQNGVPRAGDPNIGSVRLNETTGEFGLDLVGHYDLVDRLLSSDSNSYKTGNTLIDSMLNSVAVGAQFASNLSKVTTQVNDLSQKLTPTSYSLTQADFDATNTLINELKAKTTTALAIPGLPTDTTTALKALSTKLNALTLPATFPTTTIGKNALKAGLVTVLGNLTTALNGAQPALNALNKPLSISEVAKVTVNGKSSFAYSFVAKESGITSNDGTESFTGIYKWSQNIGKTVNATPVPEPSLLLGMIALGGGAIASRHKRA